MRPNPFIHDECGASNDTITWAVAVGFAASLALAVGFSTKEDSVKTGETIEEKLSDDDVRKKIWPAYQG